MSHHKNNVNPSHYKEAGRMRPGDDVSHEQNKQKVTQAQAMYRKRASVKIPPNVPTTDLPSATDTANAVDGQEAATLIDESA